MQRATGFSAYFLSAFLLGQLGAPRAAAQVAASPEMNSAGSTRSPYAPPLPDPVPAAADRDLTEHVDEPESVPPPERSNPGAGAGHNPRAQNSWQGSTGGLHVVDGSAGEVGTLRLQLGFDYFRSSDVLLRGDEDEWLEGVLSLSASPIDHLELFASLSSHSNSNSLGNPILLQVSGDTVIGAKGYYQVTPWLSAGADLRLLFLNTVGDLGIAFSGTSIGIRGAGTADLRYLKDPIPLIIRGNLGYLLDNSSRLIEQVERARYDALPLASRRDVANEDRNLVTRLERFGLGVNRVDRFQFALGVEAPLQVADDFFIQPLLEWRLDIPVNRQGYSCLAVPTGATVDAPDGCLAITGLSAAPSTLSIGARVLPPVPGLAAMIGFDIGLLGTSYFVRELAPNRPWALLIAIAYTIDTRKPEPEIREVAGPVNAPPPPSSKQRIRGIVVERGFGTGIANAVVRYPERDLNPQLTGPDGRFISYELEPGEVMFEVSHPDYEPGRCIANILKPLAAKVPPPAAAGARSELQPLPNSAAPSAAPAAPARGASEVRCELVARPRSGQLLGTITGDDGAPVAGVTVEITGPATRSVTSDAAGSFSVSDLPVGEYSARVDSPNHLLKVQPFTLSAGADTSLAISLIKKPKAAQVQLTAKEVKISSQIMFNANSAEIDERSTGLLTEIADVLQRNPSVAHVQVQGHTDNRGDPEQNLTLSQQRAEAVVQWLVGAGIDSSRLEAKGFGDARPLVPNLTPGNRAQNRRVQFIIH